jgi:glucan endo-1,3-beta-D-glucosidase
MLGQSSLVALVAASPALAAYQGFNYGSTFTTGAAKVQSDFEAEFKTSQGLINAPGVFNSARLYTTVVSFSPCGCSIFCCLHVCCFIMSYSHASCG